MNKEPQSSPFYDTATYMTVYVQCNTYHGIKTWPKNKSTRLLLSPESCRSLWSNIGTNILTFNRVEKTKLARTVMQLHLVYTSFGKKPVCNYVITRQHLQSKGPFNISPGFTLSLPFCGWSPSHFFQGDLNCDRMFFSIDASHHHHHHWCFVFFLKKGISNWFIETNSNKKDLG